MTVYSGDIIVNKSYICGKQVSKSEKKYNKLLEQLLVRALVALNFGNAVCCLSTIYKCRRSENV